MKTTSKTLQLILSGLIFISLNIKSQNKFTFTETTPDSLTCLEISGELFKKFVSNSGTYKVVLIHFNTPIDSVILKDNKAFQFNLIKDAYYALKIYKKGYATKLVSICTAIPQEVFHDKLLRFHFIADLIPEKEFEKLNPETKDFPIAIIKFNKTKKIFNYNERYTKNIRKSLYTKNNPLLF